MRSKMAADRMADWKIVCKWENERRVHECVGSVCICERGIVIFHWTVGYWRIRLPWSGSLKYCWNLSQRGWFYTETMPSSRGDWLWSQAQHYLQMGRPWILPGTQQPQYPGTTCLSCESMNTRILASLAAGIWKAFPGGDKVVPNTQTDPVLSHRADRKNS